MGNGETLKVLLKKELQIFFFLIAASAASGSPSQGLNLSHSVDLHRSCGNARSFNPLRWAGDWTCTSAAAWAAVLGFLTRCATVGTLRISLNSNKKAAEIRYLSITPPPQKAKITWLKNQRRKSVRKPGSLSQPSISGLWAHMLRSLCSADGNRIVYEAVDMMSDPCRWWGVEMGG